MPTVSRRQLVIISSFLLWGCADVPAEAPESRGPLEGVWSVVVVEPAEGEAVDPSRPGLYIFTAAHYSAVYAPGSEQREKSAVSFQPTEEEMLDQYQSIIVNSGSYEIDAAAITYRPMIAKSPGFVGGYLTGAFHVSGDTLTLRHEHLFDRDGTELPSFGEVLTLVRID
jgi:hypothetical protein